MISYKKLLRLQSINYKFISYIRDSHSKQTKKATWEFKFPTYTVLLISSILDGSTFPIIGGCGISPSAVMLGSSAAAGIAPKVPSETPS